MIVVHGFLYNDFYSTILEQRLQTNDFLQRFFNNDFQTTEKNPTILDSIFNDFYTMIYIQRYTNNDLITVILIQWFLYNDFYTMILIQRFLYNDILCPDTTILARCQRFGRVV